MSTLQLGDQHGVGAGFHPDQRVEVAADVFDVLPGFVPARVAVTGLAVPFFLAQQRQALIDV